MDIQIFVCDDAAGLIRTQAEISGLAQVVYETQGPGGETGDLTRFLVSSKRSPGAKLHSLAGKFVIVALM